MKPDALAEFGQCCNHTPYLLDRIMDNIQADTASGYIGDTVPGAESRQKHEVHQFYIRHYANHILVGQALGYNFLAQTIQINTPPIVRDRNRQHTRTMTGLEADSTLRGFANLYPLIRHLDTMIDCVA